MWSRIITIVDICKKMTNVLEMGQSPCYNINTLLYYKTLKEEYHRKIISSDFHYKNSKRLLE